MNYIIGDLVTVALISLINAVLLRAAAKWVIKKNIAFGMAYLTVFVPFAIAAGIRFLIERGVGVAVQSTEEFNVMQVVMLVVTFLILSGVIATNLKISFGKASLLAVTMAAICIGIGGIVAIVVIAVSVSTR